MKPIIYTIVILVVGLAIAVMSVDMRGLYHCSVCGKTYWGKQESIHNKPACDICHEAWYVENCGIKETKGTMTYEESKLVEQVDKVPYSDTAYFQDKELSFLPPTCVVFYEQNATEILKIEWSTGNIYWRGRLVTTDKELVDGLKDVIGGR